MTHSDEHGGNGNMHLADVMEVRVLRYIAYRHSAAHSAAQSMWRMPAVLETGRTDAKSVCASRQTASADWSMMTPDQQRRYQVLAARMRRLVAERAMWQWQRRNTRCLSSRHSQLQHSHRCRCSDCHLRG